MAEKSNKGEKKTKKTALKISLPSPDKSSGKGKKTVINMTTPLGKIKISPDIPDSLQAHVEQVPHYLEMLKKLKTAIENKNFLSALAIGQELLAEANTLKDTMLKDVKEMIEKKDFAGALTPIKQIIGPLPGEKER